MVIFRSTWRASERKSEEKRRDVRFFCPNYHWPTESDNDAHPSYATGPSHSGRKGISGCPAPAEKKRAVVSVELANVAGIGDSIGDVPFLRIVGFSAAPANASETVKSVVDYCSPWVDGRGVVDVIRQCISMNMQP